MSALYFETSALLAWLFGEENARAVMDRINDAEKVANSVQTRIETERSLLLAEKTGLITPAERQKLLGLYRRVLSGWYFFSISEEVLAVPARNFPLNRFAVSMRSISRPPLIRSSFSRMCPCFSSIKGWQSTSWPWDL
ncbi:MAG: PIN domain-containing protein [Spirochaetes bacterium]|jgi:hypothetical protein|nr:PIN domain-containing protein [Spirochaetota bacterium]